MKARQPSRLWRIFPVFALMLTTAADALLTDPVATDAGHLSGATLGAPGHTVRVYRGIPYAAPPVGDYRWKPPQPVTPWEGVREATQFGLVCPQEFPSKPLYGSVPESGMGEDCLYLNLYTPAADSSERLPVMVWFHGGGLDGASANDASWNREYLPRHGVVLVLVNARLGPLGYLAHPLLSAESEHGASGNYGQLDQVAALKWVQANIAAFGGDPGNVTIFGESGGGAKVQWLMSSPLSRGLFHRAIIQSGALPSGLPGMPQGGLPLKAAEQAGERLAQQVGASTLAELRSRSWQDIIRAAAAPDSGYRSDMTVDGWSLPDTMNNVFKSGGQAAVPLLIGMTDGDIPPLFAGTQYLVSAMQPTAPVYCYLFTQVPSRWRSLGVKAGHGFDIAYLFNHLDLLALFLGLSVPPSAGADPGFGEADTQVVEATMALWTQFARSGDPSVEGLVSWPAHEPATDRYLDIGAPLQVKQGFGALRQ